MNYWHVTLSDGSEYKETEFSSVLSPWLQLRNILKQKPGVKIVKLSLFVNGKIYDLPVLDSKSPEFKGDFIKDYWVSRMIRQELIFSQGKAEYFLVGKWIDNNDMVHSIAINTITNNVSLYTRPLDSTLRGRLNSTF